MFPSCSETRAVVPRLPISGESCPDFGGGWCQYGNQSSGAERDHSVVRSSCPHQRS